MAQLLRERESYRLQGNGKALDVNYDEGARATRCKGYKVQGLREGDTDGFSC